MGGIREIHSVDPSVIPTSPCAVYPDSGVMIINPVLWNQFNEAEKMWWTLHEEGHTHVGRDEVKADEYAWARYQDMGLPISASVTAFGKIRDMAGRPSHIDDRANAQFGRAQKFDQKMNNINQILDEECNLPPSLASGWRQQKRDARLAKIESKNKARDTRAEAALVRSQQGQGGLQGVLKQAGEYATKVGGAAAQLMGAKAGMMGGAAPADTMAPAEMPAEAPAKTKTLMYVGIGVAVLVVIGIVIYMMRKKS